MRWWFLFCCAPLFGSYLDFVHFADASVAPKNVQSRGYFIAVKKNEGDVLSALDSYHPFFPPKGRYYADPCLFEHEGVHYLFFEDYDYKKGVISYVTIGEGMELSKPQVALELPIHLSFPSFFSEEGEIYMIPETYGYRSISLFRAVQFPDQWEKKRTLVEGERFSDPILFKHDGYYWLFAATHCDRLSIFYAQDLASPFLPHPVNGRLLRGRNAGSVYSMGDRLIRPTMDCRISYGRSLILKEIVLLTPTHFVEREIGYIEPTWAPGLKGTHAYSQNEQYVVYDGRL